MIRKLVKRCGCRASASGPRIIFREGETWWSPHVAHPDTVQVTVEFVLLACDECDTEWTEGS